MRLPEIYMDPDSGFLFVEPWMVSPMFRWRLVPLHVVDRCPVEDDQWNAFFEYEGENTSRLLVQFEKDQYGRLINPAIAGGETTRRVC